MHREMEVGLFIFEGNLADRVQTRSAIMTSFPATGALRHGTSAATRHSFVRAESTRLSCASDHSRAHAGMTALRETASWYILHAV